MAQTYVKGNLYQISIIDFKPDPNQPRKVVDPEALAELAASIRQYGILTPLLFRVAEESAYLLIVAGERRFLAAKQAGLLILPAMCVEGNYAEIALVENLQRQDITSVEEAEAFKRLMVEQNYTQEQLGDMVGKARTTVSDILTINRLPQAIRDECRGDRQITCQTLIAISRKKQERGMVTAYNTYRLKDQKVKGIKQRKDPNDHAASLEIAQKTGMKIDNLDTVAWTDDEREIFRVTLDDLKNKIDRFINKPSTMLA